MFVPGCMWQVMHWLDGMARVNSWRKGWPERSRGMVASPLCVRPRLPKAAYGPECAGERSLA